LLGTGGSAAFSPFEWLDPLNDLVERFSLVMLASCVSIGIQLFLNDAMPWFSLWVLLPLAGILLLMALIFRYFQNNAGRFLFRAGTKLLIVTILLVSMVPCMAIVNHTTYTLFLDETYETAAVSLQQQEMRIAQAGKKTGIMEAITGFTEQAQQLKEKAQNLIAHILDIIVVFVIQAMILPIAMLWVFIKFVQHILGRKEAFPFEQVFISTRLKSRP